MSRRSGNADSTDEMGRSSPGGERVGRKARAALSVSVGFATLVTVLMLAAPFASAAGIVTISAPYTGWSSSNSASTSSYGCAGAHQGVAPTWSSATGTFNYAARANASSCGTGYNYGSIYGASTVTSAGFGGTHGQTSYIYLEWNMSVAARAALTFTPGTGYSYAYASVSGAVYAYLIDVTNGSFNYITTSTATLFGITFSGTGLYVIQTGWATTYQYMSATLIKGHTYEVQLTIYTYGSVSIYGGTGSGAVSIGLAGTHGLTLESLTVY